MNSLSKFGIAAVLALGVSSAAIAQDAGLDVGADAAIGADVDVGIDPMATGSINSQDSLATSIQSSTAFDLSAYNEQTPVTCVAASGLEAGADAQAISSAASSNQAIGTLRSDVEANAGLLSKLQTSCNVADFDAQDIVFVETGADGGLTFYYDDSAA
jgi:hypothetical protein